MKISKKQRHETYKRALELLKEDAENYKIGNRYGICNVMQDSIIETTDLHMLMFEIINSFKEFLNQKPLKAKKDDYWWPDTEYGYRQRVKVLKKCIELTK